MIGRAVTIFSLSAAAAAAPNVSAMPDTIVIVAAAFALLAAVFLYLTHRPKSAPPMVKNGLPVRLYACSLANVNMPALLAMN